MSYNEKWIIEIEAGQYKQTFKISNDSVNGLEEVKKLISNELLQNTLHRFSAMHADFANAFQQLQQKPE